MNCGSAMSRIPIPVFSAYVIADKDSWAEPRSGSDGFYRSLTIVKGRSIVAASGSVVFYSYGFFGDRATPCACAIAALLQMD